MKRSWFSSATISAIVFTLNIYTADASATHHVTILGRYGSFTLPVIGVKTQYGVTFDKTPAVYPTTRLPTIHFDLPRDEAARLAVYWMNFGYTGSNGALQGIEVLAPKDWIVTRSGIEANGSGGLTIAPN